MLPSGGTPIRLDGSESEGMHARFQVAGERSFPQVGTIPGCQGRLLHVLLFFDIGQGTVKMGIKLKPPAIIAMILAMGMKHDSYRSVN